MRTKTLAAAAAAALVIAGGSYAYGATTATPATPISTLTFCQSNDGEMKAIAPTSSCPKGTTKYTLSGVAGPAGLPGAPGAQGPAGVKGDPGIPGVDGAPGAQGPKGDTGLAGADGAIGPQGPAGVKGDPGMPGADGAPGVQGPQGDPGPAGSGVANLDALNGTPCRVGLPGEGTTSVSYPQAGFASQQSSITCVANESSKLVYTITAAQGLSGMGFGAGLKLTIENGSSFSLDSSAPQGVQQLATGDTLSVASFDFQYDLLDANGGFIGDGGNYTTLTASGVCHGTFPSITCDPLSSGDNLVTFDLS